jgi:hypothetical protein
MDAHRAAGSIEPMRPPWPLLLMAATLVAGCATARPRPANQTAASRAVETARSLAGHQEIVVGGVSYGAGCAALVRAAYQQAGHRLPGADVRSIHAFSRSEGSLHRTGAAPGDLVFLSDTPGGPVEHVGLVERIGVGGTVTLLHRTSRGVVRLRVNPDQPWKARGDDGQILNDVLVVGGDRISAGRLLVTYATLL